MGASGLARARHVLGIETDFSFVFEDCSLEDKRLCILPTRTEGRKQKSVDGICLGTPGFSQGG